MGGTFDPIHLGHLIAAEESRGQLALDKLLFLPTGAPPHKEMEEISEIRHRVRMVELAIASNPCFELSMVDAERRGRSYTVDTVEIFRERLGPGTELFFIIGMDSLADLLSWREPARLISLCRLGVVNRPPFNQVRLEELEGRLPGVSSRVEMVRMPDIGISSRDLRERVARGMSIKYMVPEAVEHYILESGLYR